MDLTAAPVDSPHASHAEGTYWDPARRVVRYVDMLRGDILTWDGIATTRTHVSDVAAVVRARVGGGYVIATERGFALTDDALRIEREIPVITDAGVRMNEGGCDAAGRLYCGSMAYDTRSGGGTLYRLDPDLSVTVAREHVTIPNGLVWAADNRTAHHADTGDSVIWAYDFDLDAGTLGARHPFVTFEAGGGMPDGTARDDEGGLWVALWGGGAVHRYSPEGTLDMVVDVPATNVTSCAFGGPDLRTLFITTSAQGLSTPESAAGGLFAVETSFTGAPVHPFGG